jgi:hypothetical protein
MSRIVEAGHRGVGAVACGQGALLRRVEHNPGLQVDAGRGQIPEVEEALSQRPVGHDEERGILLSLRQLQEPLPEVPSRPLLRPELIVPPQTYQRRKELRRLADLLTELPGSMVSLLHLRGPRSLSGE